MSKTFTQLYSDNPLTVTDDTIFGADKSGQTGGTKSSDIKTYLSSTFLSNGDAATLSTINLTGGQITFPATQSASAGVNVLDDYEEGTFTPVLTRATTAPTITSYVTQQAEYTKIGNLVSINIGMVINGSNITSAGSGFNIITGCPFSASIAYTSGTVGFNDMFSSTGVNSCVIVGSTIYFTSIGPTQAYVNEAYDSAAGNNYLSLQLTFTT